MFDRSPERDVAGPAARSASFADRRALAGERRLLGLERRRADDATVGRDDVARLHLHDVAGDDVDGRHQRERAVAHDLRLRDLQVRQRVTLARAFSSWREPSTTLRRISSATMIPVETSPIAKLTTVDRDQHDVHRIAELAQRDRPHRRRLLARDLVRSEPLETLRRVRPAQPRGRIGSRATPRPRRRRGQTAVRTRTPWPRLRHPAPLPLSRCLLGGRQANHRSCRGGVRQGLRAGIAVPRHA